MTRPISASASRGARDLRATFSRLRRALREVVDNETLTPTQTAVLGRLATQGDATASGLAAAERVRPQSMATTVAALLDRGLVARRPDPHDGRRQILTLSATGRDFVDDSRRTREEWLARTLQDRLSEPERQTLLQAIALLDRISAP